MAAQLLQHHFIFPAWFAALLVGALLVFSLYLWSQHRWIQRHLRDVAINRQLSFLQQQALQLRLQCVIFLLLLLAAVAGIARMAPLDSPPMPAPVTASVSTPSPVREEPAPPPVADTAHPASTVLLDPETILELYSTPDEALTDIPLDALKERYENALIGAYILHRCKRATDREIDALLLALQRDVVTLQAESSGRSIDPQALYASIVTAAEGSYQMMYFHTPCDRPEVDILEQQFAQFVMRYQSLRQKD